jgi:2-keto-4-pentenoate hydratase
MTLVVDEIWQGLKAGEIAASLPDTTVDDGQQLQLQILDKWLAAGEQLGGYKIGLTSGTSRDMFGPGIRPFGYILKSRILKSGRTVPLHTIGKRGVENELVFRVAEDVQRTGVTAADAKNLVDGVAPGFEINQVRLTTPASQGIRVAENLTQWGIVFGDFVSIDQDYEQLSVTLSRDGEDLQTVAAAGHIDDHFASIATLINRLHQFDRGLSRGDLLITGAYTRASVLDPGLWQGDFGVLGQVKLEVT